MARSFSSSRFYSSTVLGGGAVADILGGCWVYPTSSAATQQVFKFGNRTTGWGLMNNGGTWTLRTNNNSNSFGVSVTLNQWQHVALCRTSAGTWSFYLNGTQTGLNPTTAPDQALGGFVIGSDYNNSSTPTFQFPFSGYITDVFYGGGSNHADEAASTVAMLAKGYSVRLLAHAFVDNIFPLIGNTTEGDLISGLSLSENGTIGVVPGPPLIQPRRRKVFAFAPTVTVYTGTGSANVGAATAQASGTFTDPVYTGTGSATIGAATAQGVGTTTEPTYTGTASVSIGSVIAQGIGTFDAPVYTGTGSTNVGAATAQGIGTTSEPTYTGTGIVNTPAALANGQASYSIPQRTGVGVATVAAAIASGVADVTNPTYTASASVFTGAVTGQGIARFLTESILMPIYYHHYQSQGMI